MNSLRSGQLLASMAEVADFLASVDLDALPALFNINIMESNRPQGRVIAAAQLGRIAADEVETIGGLCTWAAAFDGSMHLGEEINPATSYAHRKLSALIPLPVGGLFELWTYLWDLGTDDGPEPTAC